MPRRRRRRRLGCARRPDRTNTRCPRAFGGRDRDPPTPATARRLRHAVPRHAADRPRRNRKHRAATWARRTPRRPPERSRRPIRRRRADSRIRRGRKRTATARRTMSAARWIRRPRRRQPWHRPAPARHSWRRSAGCRPTACSDGPRPETPAAHPSMAVAPRRSRAPDAAPPPRRCPDRCARGRSRVRRPSRGVRAPQAHAARPKRGRRTASSRRQPELGVAARRNRAVPHRCSDRRSRRSRRNRRRRSTPRRRIHAPANAH